MPHFFKIKVLRLLALSTGPVVEVGSALIAHNYLCKMLKYSTRLERVEAVHCILNPAASTVFRSPLQIICIIIFYNIRVCCKI